MSKVYIEAFTQSDFADCPSYVAIDVTEKFVEQLKDLQCLCQQRDLSEVRRHSYDIEWKPEAISDDLQLQGPQLIVTGDSFGFTAYPKNADYLVETKVQDIEPFLKAVALGSVRFGDLSDDDWRDLLEAEATVEAA